MKSAVTAAIGSSRSRRPCGQTLRITAENRRAGRFLVRDVLWRWNRKRWRIIDLSATGLRAEVTGSLQLRQGDRVRVALWWERVTLDLHGAVAWVRPTGRRASIVGVSFSELSATEIAGIRRLVALSTELVDA